MTPHHCSTEQILPSADSSTPRLELPITHRSRRGHVLRSHARRWGRRLPEGVPPGVLGLAALVAVVGATWALQAADPDDVAPAVRTVTPAVPPPGGFAVDADRMDETLADLVRSTSGRTSAAAPSPERDGVLVGAGDVDRAVRSGAVLVESAAGAALVRVDVRRSSGPPCPLEACSEVVSEPGDATSPESLVAVVDDDGVEVRVQAWAPPRTAGRSQGSVPTVPLLAPDELLDVAADQIWRR